MDISAGIFSLFTAHARDHPRGESDDNHAERTGEKQQYYNHDSIGPPHPGSNTDPGAVGKLAEGEYRPAGEPAGLREPRGRLMHVGRDCLYSHGLDL
jgi:hypothetical protein